ncbi:MAG: hypothetical protein J7M34_07095 [Anaerolineae bacterium]|nr:hypothetical protein [Anaerolineae bacterium]
MRNLALLLLALWGVARHAWAYFTERIAPEIACISRSLAALVYGYLATTALGLLVASAYLIATKLGLSNGVEARIGSYLIFAVTPGAPGADLHGGAGLIIISAIVGFSVAVWVRLRCAAQIRKDARERARKRRSA